MNESSEIRTFARSLPMALLRARESNMRLFRPMLNENGVTEQQWRVMRALASAPGPIDVTALTDATFLLGPSLTRILANLHKRQLIDREADPSDRRRQLISLAAQGHDLIEKIGPHSEAIYDHIARSFGTARLLELYEHLDAMAKLGGPDLPIVPAVEP